MTLSARGSVPERGPMRPASEGSSLLLRVNRNCAWNRCAFCALYKGSSFSRRELPELMAEIDGLVDPSRRGAGDAFASSGPAHVESVFLQDADGLCTKNIDLVRLLAHVVRRIPTVRRITACTRSRTLIALGRSTHLVELRRAGLTGVMVGVESGDDGVLKAMNKGCTAGD